MCRDCDFEYKVCTFFLRGRCIFGKRCRNIHMNFKKRKRKHRHQCTQPCLKNEEKRADRKSIRESYRLRKYNEELLIQQAKNEALVDLYKQASPQDGPSDRTVTEEITKPYLNDIEKLADDRDI